MNADSRRSICFRHKEPLLRLALIPLSTKPQPAKDKQATRKKDGEGTSNHPEKVYIANESIRVEASLSPSVIENFDAAHKEDAARERKKIRRATLALLAGFGVLTIYIVQAWMMQKTLNETSENFRLDQRAWVGFVEVVPLFASNSGDESHFFTKLRNSGKTPAIKVVTQVFVQDRPAESPPDLSYHRPVNASAGIVVPNGEIVLHTKRVITVSDINNGKLQLFHYGSVWYCDVFKKEHRTDFCSVFLPEKGFFAPCSFHEDVDQNTNDENCT